MGERKIYLDWLRVLAFGLLILFHVGMLYVPWDYNLKSERIFPNLELAMSAISPWRLELLFFISGVASRFLLEKLGAGGFARDRTRRLLPVLLLGMLVINPIQVYVEFLGKGYIETGYLDFWFGSYLRSAPYPNRSLPTWDHLWFLLYLLAYCLGLAAIFRFRKGASRRTIRIPLLVTLPALWLCASNVLIEQFQPVTHAFVDDWANHVRWIGVFGAGVLCASQGPFWDMLRVRRRRFALSSLALFALQLANGIYYRTGRADPFWDGIVYAVVAGVYGWSVVLTLCGYAAHHLNRRSRLLSYLNGAVLPIYVFHQPVMLVTAYLVFPLSLPLVWEVSLLIAATGLGSLAAYELFARRSGPMRFLFGLKQAPA